MTQKAVILRPEAVWEVEVEMAFWKREPDAHHARYLELCSERLDGRLDAAGGEELDAHLAGCAACRERCAELGTTRALVRALPTLQPRRSFALSPYAVERRRLGSLAGRLSRLAVGAAAALVVVVSSSVVFSGPALDTPAGGRQAESRQTAPPSGGDVPNAEGQVAPPVAVVVAPASEAGAPLLRPLNQPFTGFVEASRGLGAALGAACLGLLTGRWLTLRRLRRLDD